MGATGRVREPGGLFCLVLKMLLIGLTVSINWPCNGAEPGSTAAEPASVIGIRKDSGAISSEELARQLKHAPMVIHRADPFRVHLSNLSIDRTDTSSYVPFYPASMFGQTYESLDRNVTETNAVTENLRKRIRSFYREKVLLSDEQVAALNKTRKKKSAEDIIRELKEQVTQELRSELSGVSIMAPYDWDEEQLGRGEVIRAGKRNRETNLDGFLVIRRRFAVSTGDFKIDAEEIINIFSSYTLPGSEIESMVFKTLPQTWKWARAVVTGGQEAEMEILGLIGVVDTTREVLVVEFTARYEKREELEALFDFMVGTMKKFR